MQFDVPITGPYLGWRMRHPPYIREAEELAALSQLMSLPSAQQSTVGEEERDEEEDDIGLDSSRLPPPPPPPPLWSSVPKQHLIKVERATWKIVHRHQPVPFIPLEVQEASSVCASALKRWSNRRVRLIGTVQHHLVPWLVSVAMAGDSSRIALDLTIIAVEPPFDHLIEVFGTLDVDEETRIPQVQVQFFRKLQSEHLKRLYRAREAQKVFVPLFIESGMRKGRSGSAKEIGREGDYSSEEEPDVEASLLHPCVLKFPIR